jgi:hypothetical protein
MRIASNRKFHFDCGLSEQSRGTRRREFPQSSPFGYFCDDISNNETSAKDLKEKYKFTCTKNQIIGRKLLQNRAVCIFQQTLFI